MVSILEEPDIADQLAESASLNLGDILLPRSALWDLGTKLHEQEKAKYTQQVLASIKEAVKQVAEGSTSTPSDEDEMVDPGLIAIALVIRSRDGPRFVYHYPPLPNTKAPQPPTRFGTELDEEPLTDEDTVLDDGAEDSDLEDDIYHQVHQPFGNLKLKAKPCNNDPVDDDHYDSPQGEHIVPWEHLGEFSTTDMESILTQPRAYHKKRFELSLDPLDFVSYPMHIREDGLWKKKKVKKVKKAQMDDSGSGEGNSVENENEAEEKEKEANSEDGDDHGGMTMFSIVLVLNVPKDDKGQRIQEIYDQVIKKFNKALKHAQASSDYVWIESERILSMKEKAREERQSPRSVYNFRILTPLQDAQ
jgi:hypothetical protein